MKASLDQLSYTAKDVLISLFEGRISLTEAKLLVEADNLDSEDQDQDEEVCSMCNGTGWYKDKDQNEYKCPCRYGRYDRY
jgi:hypothetical protein